MEMKTNFKSKDEIKKYDQEGGEFMLLKEVSFTPSEGLEKILMIFKFTTAHEYRTVSMSPETFKQFRQKVMNFYDLYESDFIRES